MPQAGEQCEEALNGLLSFKVHSGIEKAMRTWLHPQCLPLALFTNTYLNVILAKGAVGIPGRLVLGNDPNSTQAGTSATGHHRLLKGSWAGAAFPW